MKAVILVAIVSVFGMQNGAYARGMPLGPGGEVEPMPRPQRDAAQKTNYQQAQAVPLDGRNDSSRDVASNRRISGTDSAITIRHAD